LGDVLNPLDTTYVSISPAKGNPKCLVPDGAETIPGKATAGQRIYYALSTSALFRSLGITFDTTWSDSFGYGPWKGKDSTTANISTKRSVDEQRIDFYFVYALFEDYGKIGKTKPFKPDGELTKRFRAKPEEIITECGTHYVEAIDRAVTVWLIVKLNGVAREDIRTLDASLDHEGEFGVKIKALDIGAKSKIHATLNEYVRRKSSSVTYSAFTYASGTSEVPPIVLPTTNSAIDFPKLEAWLKQLYEGRQKQRAASLGDPVRYHLRSLSDVYPDTRKTLDRYAFTRTQIEALDRLAKSRDELNLAYQNADAAAKDQQSQVRTLFKNPDAELKAATSAIRAELEQVEKALASCADYAGKSCSFSPKAIPAVVLLLPPPQPAGRFEVLRDQDLRPLPTDWTYTALRSKEPLEKLVLSSFKTKNFSLEYVVEAVRPNVVRFVFAGAHNGVATTKTIDLSWDAYADTGRCRSGQDATCWRFPASPGGTNLKWTGLAQSVDSWSKTLPKVSRRDEETRFQRRGGPDEPRGVDVHTVHKGDWTQNSGDGIVFAEVVNRYGAVDRLPVYRASWNYYTYVPARGNRRPPPNVNDFTLAIP